MSTNNPLQTLVNSAAIRIAEAQYRLANLFTPYQWNPERADFDRVAVFLDNPDRAFPAPSDGIKNSLDRMLAALVPFSQGDLGVLAGHIHQSTSLAPAGYPDRDRPPA